VVDGVGFVGWLPGVFCALLCTFLCLTAGTVFRMSSSMEFALWTTALIVRFWGRMVGRAGPIFLRSKWFVLLGFELARKFGGLDNDLDEGYPPHRRAVIPGPQVRGTGGTLIVGW